MFSLALILTACAEDPLTQTLIRVDAEAELVDEADNIQVVVTNQASETVLSQRVTLGPSADTLLPFVLPLEPLAGDASRTFRVTLTLRNQAQILVVRDVIGGYQRGRQLQINVTLEASCKGSECGGATTCRAGTCESPCVVGEPRQPQVETPVGPCPTPECLNQSVVHAAVGGSHGCIVSEAGHAECFGSNDFSQLAISPTDSIAHPFPIVVAVPGTPRHVGAGGSHSCVITDAGELWCWGANAERQIGISQLDVQRQQATPNRVDHPGGDRWSYLELGRNHNLLLDGGGRLYAFGANGSSQLGSNPMRPRIENAARVPCSGCQAACSAGAVWPSPESCAGRIAAGGAHSCLVNDIGELRCWGRNSDGQLGVGLGGTSLSFAPVSAAMDWTYVAAGDSHTCGIRGGRVHCFGRNAEGELGRLPIGASGAPDVVAHSGTAIAVAAGRAHSCVLLSDGTIECWGSNSFGQLGVPPSPPVATPQPVAGAFEGLVAGGDTTCARTTGGQLQCWGANGAGQLGIGSTQALVPDGGVVCVVDP